ncbi:uncharacterized protein [Diadema antillarum]|uniref:uncharacterized protein n=1 Tax=Diadema antillarum TaxID=105358 RepID=UPI003A87955A
MLVVYVPQCMEPCLNGGTCFNDMCMCRMGFEGPRCEIELGEDYYIRLTVPSDQSPTVGSMVTVICEVVGWSSFGGIPTPSWIQPSGATVVNGLDDKDALMRGPTVEVLSSTAARLTVVNFQPFLSGNYNCTVGDQVASILLTLECWPECLNGGTCFNGKCLCTNEFRGERCEVPLSSLTQCLIPCTSGGSCVGGQCFCPEGFRGEFCEMGEPERSCQLPCVNGGTCVDGICQCPDGYVGYSCEIPVCYPDCLNEGVCYEGRCLCQQGFEGDRCEFETCYIPCANGGTCVNRICECLQGFGGPSCETSLIIIPGQQVVQQGTPATFTCIYEQDGQATPVWYGPDGNVVPLVQASRGDLGAGYNVFVERLFGQGVRLTISNMRNDLQGIYVCEYGGIINTVNVTFTINNGESTVSPIERNTTPLILITTAPPIAAPTTPALEVTPQPTTPSPASCSLIENGMCDVLPYQYASFPNAFANDADLAGLFTTTLIPFMSECSANATFALCYLFYQPCDPSYVMCADVCSIAQSDCPPFLSQVLTVLGFPVMEKVLSLCASLPDTSCIQPDRKTPTDINVGCQGECLNGGHCVAGRCLCPTEFTGEFCETPAYLTEFEILILPDYEGIPYEGTNLTVICEVTPPNMLQYPIWTGTNGQQVLPKQPGASERIYVDQVSTTTARLVIKNVQATDEGSYFCNVGVRSAPYTLFVLVPDCLLDPCLNGGSCLEGTCQCPIGYRGPRCQEQVITNYTITIMPKPTRPYAIGTEVSFLCQVAGGRATPVWLHPLGYAIQSRLSGSNSRSFIEVTSDSTVRLVITDLQPEDSGLYLCLVDTSFEELNITVEVGPSFSLVITPGFHGNPQPGANLTFICEKSWQDGGTSVPLWYSPQGNQIAPRQVGGGGGRVFTQTLSLSTVMLHIIDVGESDEGIYTCRTPQATASLDVTLTVPSCLPECLNGGHCQAGVCVCPYGFQGDYCERRDPEALCLRGFCLNGGTCDYNQCQCLPGFFGENCESRVAAEYNITIRPNFINRPHLGQEVVVLCQVQAGGLSYPQPAWLGPNGNVIPSLRPGTASRVYTSIQGPSTTALHFQGLQPGDVGVYTCEVDMNMQTILITIDAFPPSECIPPCLNGGTCLDGVCHCLDQFLGTQCEEEIPQPCNLPCQNNGICYDGRCHCATFFTGQYCQTRVGADFEIVINPVTFDPPSVGDNVRVTCTYIGGSGNTQPTWVNPEGELIRRMDQGGSRHVSVEEDSSMSTTLVINNIIETDSGIYTCFVGEAENEFDITIREAECVPQCQNNGLCSMGMCMCPEAYGGIACEYQITDCDYPCANGGTCDSGRCICPPGFQGSFCQIRIYESEGVRIVIRPQPPVLPPVGRDLQLVCEVENPGPFQRPIWLSPNGQPVDQGEAAHISSQHLSPTATQLSIRMVERGDSGIYTCVIGSYTSSFTVIIYKMPCVPDCQNGGTCSDGICLCPPGYSGPQCEYRGMVTCSGAVAVSIKPI